jgi:hypothetical protein
VYFFSLDAGGSSASSARVSSTTSRATTRAVRSPKPTAVSGSGASDCIPVRPVHFEATSGPTGTVLDVQSGSLEEFLSGATGTTRRHRTVRYGTRPSTTSRGRCAGPPRPSRPTRYARPMGSPTPRPNPSTTTVPV